MNVFPQIGGTPLARIDLNRLIPPPESDDADEREYRSTLTTAQRSGIEQVSGLESLGPDDIPLLDRLSQVSQLSGLPTLSSLPTIPEPAHIAAAMGILALLLTRTFRPGRKQ